jgi:RimJ/RimL family protein N-acetyltransferase
MFELADLDWFVTHMQLHDAESGTEGELPYGPYEASAEIDVDAFRERHARGWAAPLDAPGWRRVWGAFEDHDGPIIGHVDLQASGLATALHRARVGIGVLRPGRGRGLGRRLLEAAVAWARAEPRLAWLDLGVFAGNDRAQRLYERLGFIERGRTPDRFRVDGRSIEDISMSLRVGP